MRYLYAYIITLFFSYSSIHAIDNNEKNNCNLSAPTTSLTTSAVTVNSELSGEKNFTPASTTIDILVVTNEGTGQVDFKITSAVHIQKIILVNNSTGTVNFKASGNFPYPTITYCTLDDPRNTAIFENSVNQISTVTCNTSACFSSGATLASVPVSVSHNLIWYDAISGGNQLSNTQPLSDGRVYYAANNDGAGCESNRIAIVTCVDDSPVNCYLDAFLVQDNDFFTVDLASGNASQSATDVLDSGINSIGYNPKDGYIWGTLNAPSKSIVRIGGNYNTKLFYIPSFPTNSRFIGDIDQNGMYFLKGPGKTFYKIELDPASTNYTKLVGTLLLSQKINIHDWGFNPQDNLLYAVEKISNILYRINPNNGAVTSLGIIPILSGNNYGYGAVYFDSDGNFYISSNDTGTIYITYQVHNISSGGFISSNLFAAGPSSNLNDGARCPTAYVAQEICDNNIDDDGDGLVDCDDYVCSNVGDCEEIDDLAGGNNGGLESNNRLSQKISNRNYKRVINSHSFDKRNARKLIKSDQYGKQVQNSFTLEEFIPLDILSNTFAIESSPIDLTEITNASKVFSVDYIRDNNTIAAILLIETHNGAYEHSKYICDRLQGAQILSISSFQFLDKPFSVALVKQPDNTKEYVFSFAAKLTNTGFSIESHWNLEHFDSEGHYYNFQIWTNNVNELYKLSTELFRLIEAQKNIVSVKTSEPPAVYVKKATYNRGRLDLEITNTIEKVNVNLIGGIRTSETNPIEQVNYTIPIDNNSYTSHVSVATGSFFDGGFRLYSGEGYTPDDLFISDGTWGVDDFAASSKVEKFEVIPQQSESDTEYSLERNIEFIGETADYIAIYRSFTPRFIPIDLTNYNMLEFKAKGIGLLSVQMVKPEIADWNQRHKINLKLTNSMTNYKIPLSEFKDITNSTIDLSAVSSMLFVMKSDNGNITHKELSLHDIKFTEVSSDLLSTNTDKITISLLGNDSSISVRFNSSNIEPHTLKFYDINGRKVIEKLVYPNIGLNTLNVSTQKLHRGFYIVHLSSITKQFNPEKYIIPK